MSVEKFTYKSLLHPPATEIAHFSFRVIPPELRTAEYDRRWLNGRTNQKRPYSAEDHLDIARWKDSQALRNQIQSGQTVARIAICEAALQTFGGGDPETDREVQRRAIQHVAEFAIQNEDSVRVVPFGADARRAATDEFMIAGFEGGVSKMATYNLFGATIHDDPVHVGRTMTNFNEIWKESLPGEASIERLYEIAGELDARR